MLRTEAPRTKIQALFLSINRDGGRVDVRCPAPVGPALGMAYIMTKKRRFPAQIALQCNYLLEF